MVISEQFVFAHIPKTGGVFLQDVIRRHFPVERQWDGGQSHHSIEFLPPGHRDKPVFAVLRNPWAWYLSWFSYCRAEGGNEEFRRNYNPETGNFSECIRKLLQPNHSDPVINEYMERHNIGLFEMHRYHIMDTDCPDHDVSYGRLEHLQEDFLAFLGRHSIAIPDGLDSALARKPVNTSRHGAWQDAYDEALFTLVAEKERRIVRIGNYRDMTAGPVA